MKRITTLLAVYFALVVSLSGQEKPPKYHFKVQPFNGIISSNSNEPNTGPFDYEQDLAYPITGIRAAFLIPVSIFNIGAGIEYTYVIGSHDGGYDYNESMPKVFIMLEAGNAKKRNRVSSIVTAGFLKSYISGNVVFYAGLGPSFNIGNHYRKAIISLHPYVEHWFDSGNYTYIDNRNPPPPWGYTPIPYKLYFCNYTFNMSVIIQLNGF